MIKSCLPLLALAAVSVLPFQSAEAHCQIPCGIYNDQNRLDDLRTDFTTIEKSVTKINELTDAHDVARWTMNKEQHAESIMNAVEDYYLSQRLKVDEMESNKEAYIEKLVLCHKLIVHAMKCKQSKDMADVKQLDETLTAFTKAFAVKE